MNEYLAILDRVHDELALARGSVRARRGQAVIAADPTLPVRLSASVDQVISVLNGQVTMQTAAGWDRVTEFADCPGPVRFGTARVGIGDGRCADVPVLVPLLGAGHVVINPPDPAAVGTLVPQCAAEISAIVDNLVLRALASTAPASLLVIGDRFMPSFLDRDDVYEHRLAFDIDPVAPGQMDNLLARLTDDVERIQRSPGRAEPWRLVILSGLGAVLSEQHMEELGWLLRTGPGCGIHAILIDTPPPPGIPAETIHVSPRRIRCSTAGPLLEVRPDGVPLPGSPAMVALDERFKQGGLSAAELLAGDWWTESSRDGLAAFIGDVGGVAEQVSLADSPPHALIGGPSGSGKTNFIYALLFGLATRYSPDEVEFCLMDFKESVSFSSLAPGADWLPHARLIGVNINQDREFGLAMLRHLRERLQTRSAAVKREGAHDLAGLRRADPDGRWPRVVAIIDEFQVLLASHDSLTEEAAMLLEDLARRGRSFGIHLVLSSQDVSGIEALWGRPALVAQLTSRIALPGAVRILADDNPAAAGLPKHHAIVNSQSGVRGGDRRVRIPHFDDSLRSSVKSRLWERRRPDLPAPAVFDGDQIPVLAESIAFQSLAPTAADHRIMVLGKSFDVTDRAAQATLTSAPGRNLAVIGTRIDEVRGVLGAAAVSVARQCAQGDARFTVLAGSDATDLRDLIASQGHQVEYVDRPDIPAFLRKVTADAVRHYIVFAGVDAAAGVLRADGGHEVLRQVLLDAPETGVHLLGWWRSAYRLKEDLSEFGSHVDDLAGVWVALDVQGDELSGLPGADMVRWHPRPWRGLWFDRAAHSRPLPLIPFAGETR